jgi:hypothetical protein
MSLLKIISMPMGLFMTFNTYKLILELLNQELKRANRIPTLMYHQEIEEAKKDFLEHLNTPRVNRGL